MMNRCLNFLLLLTVCISCQQKQIKKDLTLRGTVFGTTYTIVALDVTKDYQKSIDSLFYRVNKSISTYLPNSDISRINKGDTTVVADEILLELLKKSKRIFKETNGYFDPTVGNLVNAWGFGPEKGAKKLDSLFVKEQMKFVGLDKIQIVNNKIVKKDSKLFLDFNSIGKGFGIDIIARFLDSKNVENYMIEIGGEIRGKGIKKNGLPWKVQIENPTKKETREAYTFLDLLNKSMATSGNYRKFRIAENGQKYVHTVNPKTGFATESNLLSVSVIAAKDCADVDAYATAFMAMGLEKTKAFLDKNKHIQAILIYFDAHQKLTSYSTYTYN